MRLIQISDCHFRAKANELRYGQNADANLERVLSQVRAWRPDRIVATGDLADTASVEAYERLFERFRSLACPVHILAGNHDDLGAMRSQLGQGIDQPLWIDHPPWRLVMINSHVDGQPWGRVSREELKRVEQAIDCPHHVVAFVHHPPAPVGSPWADRQGLTNGNELVNMLLNKPIELLSFGHIHHLWQGRYRGLKMVSAPATFSQAKPGCTRFIDDDRPPGARWFELGENGELASGVLRAL